jgi:hypothetical protein
MSVCVCPLPSVRPPIAVTNSMMQIAISVYRTLRRFRGSILSTGHKPRPRALIAEKISNGRLYHASITVLSSRCEGRYA